LSECLFGMYEVRSNVDNVTMAAVTQSAGVTDSQTDGQTE